MSCKKVKEKNHDVGEMLGKMGRRREKIAFFSYNVEDLLDETRTSIPLQVNASLYMLGTQISKGLQ